MNDRAERRAKGNSVRFGDRMRNIDVLDAERATRERFAGTTIVIGSVAIRARWRAWREQAAVKAVA